MQFVAKTVATGWATRFVAQRLFVLTDSWRRYSTEWEDNVRTWQVCKELQNPTRACSEAFAALERSPFVRAWDDVAAMTHLCGDRPCGDLAWAGLALGLVVALLALQVLRQAKALVADGAVPLSWRDPRARLCPDPKWCPEGALS